MAKGDLVFIDIETTGLDWNKHSAIEIAWMAGDMEQPEVIFPYRYTGKGDQQPVWQQADPEAMEINDFFNRYPNGVKDSDISDLIRFLDVIEDSTLVGANVRFDARFIEKAYGFNPEPWHHRLFDLQAYAAGVFRWPAPKSWEDTVDEIIKRDMLLLNPEEEDDNYPDFSTEPDHTAANDVKSVQQAYYWLRWFTS